MTVSQLTACNSCRLPAAALSAEPSASDIAPDFMLVHQRKYDPGPVIDPASGGLGVNGKPKLDYEIFVVQKLNRVESQNETECKRVRQTFCKFCDLAQSNSFRLPI